MTYDTPVKCPDCSTWWHDAAHRYRPARGAIEGGHTLSIPSDAPPESPPTTTGK